MTASLIGAPVESSRICPWTDTWGDVVQPATPAQGSQPLVASHNTASAARPPPIVLGRRDMLLGGCSAVLSRVRLTSEVAIRAPQCRETLPFAAQELRQAEAGGEIHARQRQQHRSMLPHEQQRA